MSPASLILNLLWIIFGGLEMALGWLVATVIVAITIVGLPWARSAFSIALYTLVPFGRTAISRDEYSGVDRPVIGFVRTLGNVVWLLLAGWWLALGHVLVAAILAVTLIGIPFAWAHLKLARLALWPVGRIIVSTDEASLIRRERGSRQTRSARP